MKTSHSIKAVASIKSRAISASQGKPKNMLMCSNIYTQCIDAQGKRIKLLVY